jgi:glucose/arabinose dehydrogenase
MIQNSRMARLIWLILGLLLISACGSTAGSPTPAATGATAPAGAAAPTSAAAPAGGAARPTAQMQPTPEIGSPKALRDDITIKRMLQTGGGFVRLKLDPSTNTIYYMNNEADIYSLTPQAEGEAKETKVYTGKDIGVAEGFGAAGMAFAPDGTLYVLGNIGTDTTNQVVVHKGVAGADGKRTWSTLVSTVPYEHSGTQFDHNGNGMVVSPDGAYLYMNIGSRTDHGEVQDTKGAHPKTREVALSSAIFRIPTNADDQTLPNDAAELKSKGYTFTDGTRNAYDLAFGPNGDLFAIDNGPDADLPDELNWIQEGKHYGFPWRFGNVDNPQRDPNYDPSKDGRLQTGFFAVQSGFYAKDPEFPPPPDGVTFTDPIANKGPDGDIFREADGGTYDGSDVGQPTYSFTPHRSQLGLVFDTANALGGDLAGQGFMVSWGAAAGTLPDPGRDLLAVKLTKNGDTYEAQTTQLAVGFDHPVDAALQGKKLYVLDWGGRGAIWEVTLP